MDVGPRLKQVRLAAGFSQRQLAKRAGVTNSTISMIERSTVSPSVSSLKKVLSGVPMSLVEFFDVETQPEPLQVVYQTDERLDLSVTAEVQMHLIGRHFPKRAIAFMVETYAPGSDTGEELYVHQGEEAGLVIAGRFELTVDDTVYNLGVGDGYYFDSTRPHRFCNPFDETCTIVSATTPANF